MSILDGVLGGLMGAGVTTVVQGLVAQFEQNGLGSVVQSWVGNGTNQPIDPGQIQQALGPDKINALAAKTGLSPDEITSKLAELLPEAVNKLTPNGAVQAAA
jgi:uncharacterized protein YidB (DUF937 family)